MRGFSFSVFKIPQSKIFSFSLFERFLISAQITTFPKVLICKALSKKPASILDKTVRKSRLVHLVEVGGVEPPSESTLTECSPGADDYCGSLPSCSPSRRQTVTPSGQVSFMMCGTGKAYRTHIYR